MTNFAMPLIRYAIGDRGTLSPREECLCDRRGQILERVSGRSVDAFRTQDGTLIDGEYFTHLLYFRDWVRKFQVVQTDHSRIVFRIVRSSSDCETYELDEIAEKTRAVMGSACTVEFEFTADILAGASGKYRYTISEVQHPA
jgi:phenylacetate-CoA ligase